MFWGSNCFKTFFRVGASYTSNLVDVCSEIESALQAKKAVVALESTIITHGMPHPQNYETALSLETIIRDQGCIPAHIAVYEGRIKVGLTHKQLQRLADPAAKPVKISRRDFPYAISNRMNGGTTVCGTLLVAGLVGINIFVTGGIGGVHRKGEDTMDISADIKELGRHPIMVVSSGVKSILDIQLTLEYLETEGVCVASYGPAKHFPAFYSDKSGCLAPFNVTTPYQAAQLLRSIHELHMNSGLLLAVPVPTEFSIDFDIMNDTIDLALKEADKTGIKGKDITPYVLDKVSALTKGKSLETNKALIKNNAFIGAQIAKEFEKSTRLVQQKVPLHHFTEAKAVVVGGSVLDCVINLEADLMLDGRTLAGKIEQTPGGVGRNLADALGKLYRTSPLLLSAVGSDPFGSFLLDSVKHIDSNGVIVKQEARTACYSALIDKSGEAKLGVGDMQIHSFISPELVITHRNKILSSPIIIMDGNIPQETMDHILSLATHNKIPVWFEPTDLSKAIKPFNTDLWKAITYTSPNINELELMAKAIGISGSKFNESDMNIFLRQLAHLAVPLAEYIPVIMVTLGKKGLLMVSRIKPDEPVINFKQDRNQIFIRYYPVQPLPKIVNAVGAGDSTAAGFISGILQGFTEPECVNLGIRAAQQALNTTKAIPNKFELATSLRLLSEFMNISVT